jgi:hypothetical protein
MAIYVDDAKIKFRHMKMCHLIADSDAELMEFAGKLGLRPEWKHRDHFDVCITKRQKAIDLGAIEISQHELARRVIVSRGKKIPGSLGSDPRLF